MCAHPPTMNLNCQNVSFDSHLLSVSISFYRMKASNIHRRDAYTVQIDNNKATIRLAIKPLLTFIVFAV
jgi:hypothetical protein